MPSTPSPLRRRLALALGPALFVLVELFFRPVLPDGALDSNPAASAELVRHALAATLWIAAWWFTEAVPIPATSLLPIVLFPLLGLGSATEVTKNYAHEIVFLFLGGLLLALAMERTGLHERVAIRIIRLFGSGRRALVLGFMVATATMSMWISNTATTVMLLPVALAVLGTVEREKGDAVRAVDAAFPTALLLGIAYAANIGGLGTPIGSPPNIIFQNVYRAKTGVEIGFGEWMLYGVPVVVVLLPLAWWLLVRKVEPRRSGEAAVELPRFGPMTAPQRWVFLTFMTTATLWITRGDFGDVAGWGSRLAEHGVVVRDSTVAIASALVLFVAPAGRDGGRVLDWSVAPKLPWGVLLLMGAGFAISQAFDTSGLTLWVGGRIEAFGSLELGATALFLVLLVAVVAVSIVVTEFASNTASANILLPVIFGVSAALGPDRFPPDLLMVSCALACTLGFAVPAGTPPNALVFSTERISIGRFVRTGALVDVLGLVLIVVLVGGRILFR
ncbi:MAG: DASS family sodium-coupled anion symporter [Planctomycetota bacterium]